MNRQAVSAHIDRLFLTYPDSPRARELQEELRGNCLARFDDLVAAGIPEVQAYEQAIGSIGDIGDLLPVEASQPPSPPPRRSSLGLALFVCSGIFCYFLGVAAMVLFKQDNDFLRGSHWQNYDSFGVVALLLMAGLGTCLIVMGGILFGDRAVARRMNGRGESKRSRIQSAVSSLVWTAAVFTFLYLGFTQHKWGTAWLVFIAAAVIEGVVELIAAVTERSR